MIRRWLAAFAMVGLGWFAPTGCDTTPAPAQRSAPSAATPANPSGSAAPERPRPENKKTVPLPKTGLARPNAPGDAVITGEAIEGQLGKLKADKAAAELLQKKSGAGERAIKKRAGTETEAVPSVMMDE